MANLKKETGKKHPVRKFKLRLLLWPLVAIVAISGAVWVLHAALEQDPLTSKEILGKENWSEEELIRALSRTFTPQSNLHNRNEIILHLRGKIDQYPETTRQAIRNQALAMALTESLKQFRVMPEADRKILLNKIYDRAERTYTEINRMSEEDKTKLREELSRPEAVALNNEIQKIMYKDFTAAEQQEFAPITKLWIRTLKEIR